MFPPEFRPVAVNMVRKVLARIDQVDLKTVKQNIFAHVFKSDNGNFLTLKNRIVLPVLPRAVFRNTEHGNQRIFNILPGNIFQSDVYIFVPKLFAVSVIKGQVFHVARKHQHIPGGTVDKFSFSADPLSRRQILKNVICIIGIAVNDGSIRIEQLHIINDVGHLVQQPDHDAERCSNRQKPGKLKKTAHRNAAFGRSGVEFERGIDCVKKRINSVFLLAEDRKIAVDSNKKRGDFVKYADQF